MSVDENQRTARNSVSENSSMLDNLHIQPLGDPNPSSSGSGLRSRTQSESDNTDSGGSQNRRQTSQTGQSGKQTTPNNINMDGIKYVVKQI